MENSTVPAGTPMTIAEIRRLLDVTGWSQVELARRLDMSEAAVSRWLSGDQKPTGPARILMRQWLKEAMEQRRRQLATA